MALFDFLWFFGICFTGYRHLPATEATRQALPGEGHWPQSESPADGHPQVPGRLCLLCAHQHQRYMHGIHTWSKNYFLFSYLYSCIHLDEVLWYFLLKIFNYFLVIFQLKAMPHPSWLENSARRIRCGFKAKSKPLQATSTMCKYDSVI